MSAPAIWFSDDQAEAWDTAAEVLRGAGVDVEESTTTPKVEGPGGVLAILGLARKRERSILVWFAAAVFVGALGVVVLSVL